MTKRERDAIAKKLDALMVKVGKKRDELRELVSDVTALVDSVENAAGELDWTVQHLNSARRSLDDAADAASQYA